MREISSAQWLSLATEFLALLGQVNGEWETVVVKRQKNRKGESPEC